MTQTPINLLADYGQSFWYDNIDRSMLSNGILENLIKQDDLKGITSNPAIFEKAIINSNDYDAALADLIRKQPNAGNREYFFSLAVEDIQNAADQLKPVYDKTQGRDGYVSLEVSPDLAYNTQASIKEARELFLRLGRPNIMIKIPATKEGIPAIEQLIADGVNINATLLFSVERYEAVANAYINGIKHRHEKGMPMKNISSVASFFISRVDGAMDSALEQVIENGTPEQQRIAQSLLGKVAILNAKSAYNRYIELFGEKFVRYTEADANPQRLLWASTGVKNPAYKDTMYIDDLIGPNTVNTIPPATLKAFKDHGLARPTLEHELEQVDAKINQLNKLDLATNDIMASLEKDGIALFAKAFDHLLAAIDEKTKTLKKIQSSNAA